MIGVALRRYASHLGVLVAVLVALLAGTNYLSYQLGLAHGGRTDIVPSDRLAELLKNGGFEDVEDGRTIAWEFGRWAEEVEGSGRAVEAHARTGVRAGELRSTKPQHLRWVQLVKVEKQTDYIFEAWIKSEGVAHGEGAANRGANVTIVGVTPLSENMHKESAGVFGDHNWQKISLSFLTVDRTSTSRSPYALEPTAGLRSVQRGLTMHHAAATVRTTLDGATALITPPRMPLHSVGGPAARPNLQRVRYKHCRMCTGMSP